jgi:hypothetical protein
VRAGKPTIGQVDAAQPEPGDIGPLQRQQPWPLGDLLGQQPLPGRGNALLRPRQLVACQARDAGEDGGGGKVAVVEHHPRPAQPELHPAGEPCSAAAHPDRAGLDLHRLRELHVIQVQTSVGQQRTKPSCLLEGRPIEYGVGAEGRPAELGVCLEGRVFEQGADLEGCRVEPGVGLEDRCVEPGIALEGR